MGDIGEKTPPFIQNSEIIRRCEDSTEVIGVRGRRLQGRGQRTRNDAECKCPVAENGQITEGPPPRAPVNGRAASDNYYNRGEVNSCVS